MLRSSQCMLLPSQRSLRDYTHYTSSGIGFSAEVDRQLRDLVDFTQERNRLVKKITKLFLPYRFVSLRSFLRYVGLLMDEVYIKDDLSTREIC